MKREMKYFKGADESGTITQYLQLYSVNSSTDGLLVSMYGVGPPSIGMGVKGHMNGTYKPINRKEFIAGLLEAQELQRRHFGVETKKGNFFSRLFGSKNNI